MKVFVAGPDGPGFNTTYPRTFFRIRLGSWPSSKLGNLKAVIKMRGDPSPATLLPVQVGSLTVTLPLHIAIG